MKIIVVTGQTATGKTSLVLSLVKKYNGELINADSRQIYKYLDIITGKDLTHKHWFYDVVNPNEYFSSFDFVKLSLPTIKSILLSDKTPIIVGGSYLYLKHLLYGVETDNIPPNLKLRRELNETSVKKLQEKLQTINPETYNGLNHSDKNNPQRLIRKIEIAMSTPIIRIIGVDKSNKKMTINIADRLGLKKLSIEFIGLKFSNKAKLIDAISDRVEKRLKQGAVKEVKNLLQMGYTDTDPGLKTIGYQQIIKHLQGVLSLQEAVNQWITKEVQYAKRQYTFMKKDKNIIWREV